MMTPSGLLSMHDGYPGVFRFPEETGPVGDKGEDGRLVETDRKAD